jgi:hypothetical protein
MKKILVSTLSAVLGLQAGFVALADTPAVEATLAVLTGAVNGSHFSSNTGVPLHFDFAEGPVPSTSVQTEKLDRVFTRNSKIVDGEVKDAKANVWNHLDFLGATDSSNVVVELGDIHSAVLFQGEDEWLERNWSLPTEGYGYPEPLNGTARINQRLVTNIHSQNKTGSGTAWTSRTVTQIAAAGNSFAGLGLRGWTNRTSGTESIRARDIHTHGWTRQNGFTISGEPVQAYIVWGYARAVKKNTTLAGSVNGLYQYRVGGDQFNVDDGTGRTAICHGQAREVVGSWRIYIAHNMSVDTVTDRYNDGTLPVSLLTDR